MYELSLVAHSGVDWAQAIELINAETDRPLTEAAEALIEVQVSDRHDRTILNATSADGSVQRPNASVFQWRFTRDQMHSLREGRTYRIGCRLTVEGKSIQLFGGTLAYIDGDLS